MSDHDDEAFDESTCDRCARRNPVWWTPPEVWPAVYGRGGQPTRQGVLCPSCFIDDAEAVGVTAPRGTWGWLVSPLLEDARRQAEYLADTLRSLIRCEHCRPFPEGTPSVHWRAAEDVLAAYDKENQ